VPSDVDVRVMMTFLEFYETLVGFINYKLFSSEGLAYPPVLDRTKDAGAAGLAAYSLVPKGAVGAWRGTRGAPSTHVSMRSSCDAHYPVLPAGTASAVTPAPAPSAGAAAQVKARLKSLPAKMAAVAQADASHAAASAAESEPEEQAHADDALDEFPPSLPGGDILASSRAQAPSQLGRVRRQADGPRRHGPANVRVRGWGQLFAGCIFFIGREVPRALVEFVILACGGRVGWEDGLGSPFAVDATVRGMAAACRC
jgi:pescadillo